MVANPQQPTLDDALMKMRSELVLANSNAEQKALNAFDVLENQLRNYNKIAIDLKKENQRLGELCKNNNIDYSIPPQTKIPDSKPVEVESKPKK